MASVDPIFENTSPLVSTELPDTHTTRVPRENRRFKGLQDQILQISCRLLTGLTALLGTSQPTVVQAYAIFLPTEQTSINEDNKQIKATVKK